jgi:hypothetical protein
VEARDSCVDTSDETCVENAADPIPAVEMVNTDAIENWGDLAPDVAAGNYVVDLANVLGTTSTLQLNNVSSIVLTNASYVCAYLARPSLPPAFSSLKEFGKYVLVQWFPETSNRAILVVLNVETERVEVFAGRKPKKKLNKKKLKKLYKDKIGKALLAEKQFDEALVFFSGKILTLVRAAVFL